MKRELANLGKHTTVYAAGVIVGKAVSFIMLPIYTTYLTPADYGTLELLIMTSEVITMIAGMGLTSGVFKYYYECSNTKEQKEVVSTVFFMTLALCLAATIIGWFFSDSLALMVFGQLEYRSYIQTILIVFLLQSGLFTVPALFMRAMQHSTLFVSLNLIKLSIQVALNIVFLVKLKMGVMGVLYSTVISHSLIGLCYVYYTMKHVGVQLSYSKAKMMAKFGYPFVFVSLSSFVLTFSDRYFLNHFADLDSVGIYALAYKFGFLLGFMAIAPFEQIWEPRRFEVVKQENAAALFSKVFLYYNIILVSLALFICLFVKDFLTVMSQPSYLQAHDVVPVVILCFIIKAWTNHCNLGIYLNGLSRYMAIISVVAALGVMILSLILVPIYGIYGAAWAAVGAFSLQFLLIYRISQRAYFINYEWARPIILCLISMCIYGVSLFARVDDVFGSLVANTVFMSIFAAIVYRLFLDQEAKDYLKEFIKARVYIKGALPKSC